MWVSANCKYSGFSVKLNEDCDTNLLIKAARHCIEYEDYAAFLYDNCYAVLVPKHFNFNPDTEAFDVDIFEGLNNIGEYDLYINTDTRVALIKKSKLNWRWKVSILFATYIRPSINRITKMIKNLFMR